MSSVKRSTFKRGPFKHPKPLVEGQLLKDFSGTIYQVIDPVNDTFNGHIVTLRPIVLVPDKKTEVQCE